jgi:hypothetical protein
MAGFNALRLVKLQDLDPRAVDVGNSEVESDEWMDSVSALACSQSALERYWTGSPRTFAMAYARY